MSASCCNHGHDHGGHDHSHGLTPQSSARYRRVLWLALALNAAMFVVELVAGVRASSVSLLADSLDFFGDAANYGISLAVLGMALRWRARAAVVKGASMALFGVYVLGQAGYNVFHGQVPEATTMGIVGAMALVVNVLVAVMLYAWRDGDANMRSVWLCSRNDAIGNVAVMVAALGVFGTGTGWPDLAVAVVMAVLALSASRSVLLQARAELRGDAVAAAAAAGPHNHGHAHHH